MAKNSTRTLALVDGIVDLDRARVHRGQTSTKLSAREVALLRLLAERTGEAVGRDELLRRVWGYRRDVVTRSVDLAVRRLRLKIEADPSEPRHLLTVRSAGYRLVPLDSPSDPSVEWETRSSTLVVMRLVDRPARWSRDPDGMVAALEVHDRIVRECVHSFGGHAFDLVDDAFRVSFSDDDSAGAFCSGVLEALGQASWPGAALQVAIGSSRGTVVVRRNPLTGSPQVGGAALNRAVQLAGEAQSGEVRTADREPSTARRPPHPSLPRPKHALIGREAELAELGRAVEAHPFVAIVGPPGIGKSHLAAVHAWNHLGGFDVIYWADVGEQPIVPLLATIARLPWDSDLEQLARASRRSLWVLDSADTVPLDTVRRLSSQGASIILTRRRRSDDVVQVVLGPLNSQAAAVLWRQHSASEDTRVAQILERLDGLPWAIEALATRTRVLTPRQVLDRLDRFSQSRLADRVRDVLAMLDDRTAQTARRLAVFADSFTVDMVDAVGGEGSVDALEDLLAHALVQGAQERKGRPRYRLLHLVRLCLGSEVAGEDLDRHMHCFAALARADDLSSWSAEVHLPDLERAFDRAVELGDPARGALARARVRVHADGVDLAQRLAWLDVAIDAGDEPASTLVLRAECLRSTDPRAALRDLDAADPQPPGPLRARSIRARCRALMALGADGEAVQVCVEGLSAVADPDWRTRLSLCRARALRRLGDTGAALHALQRARLESPDPELRCLVEINAAQLWRDSRRTDQTDACLERALDIAVAHGWRTTRASILASVALLRIDQQRYVDAETVALSAAELCRQLGDQGGQCLAVSRSAEARQALGDPAAAAARCAGQDPGPDAVPSVGSAGLLAAWGRALHELGELDLAAHRLTLATGLARRTPLPALAPILELEAATALADAGKLDLAEEALEGVALHGAAAGLLAGLFRAHLLVARGEDIGPTLEAARAWCAAEDTIALEQHVRPDSLRWMPQTMTLHLSTSYVMLRIRLLRLAARRRK